MKYLPTCMMPAAYCTALDQAGMLAAQEGECAKVESSARIVSGSAQPAEALQSGTAEARPVVRNLVHSSARSCADRGEQSSASSAGGRQASIFAKPGSHDIPGVLHVAQLATPRSMFQGSLPCLLCAFAIVWDHVCCRATRAM